MNNSRHNQNAHEGTFCSFLAESPGAVTPDMYREIRSQPKAWEDELERIPCQVEDVTSRLPLASTSVVDVVGIGSSENAAWIAATSADYGRICVQQSTSYHPVGDVIIAISQSGESTDTIEAAARAKRHGVPVVVVTANIDSTLAKMATEIIALTVPPERSIAATVSMTTTVIALELLLAKLRHRRPSDASGMGDRLRALLASQRHRGSELHRLRIALENVQYLAVLGDGAYTGVAREIALKIRETTGTIAEGCSPREYRHGPMEVLGAKHLAATGVRRAAFLFEPCLVGAVQLINFYESLERNFRGTEREFSLLRITAGQVSNTGIDIALPDAGEYTPLLAVVLLGQMLAYELALTRGLVPGTSQILRKVMVSA